MSKLQSEIEQIEKTVGLYTKSYRCLDDLNHKGLVQDIPYREKPAQKLLVGLGGATDLEEDLSIQPNNMTDTPAVLGDVVITPFLLKPNLDDTTDVEHSKEKGKGKGKGKIEHHGITITDDRIRRLLSSAKIYINTNIIPTGLYKSAMDHRLITPHDTGKSTKADVHWQNLAVGICHAQEIDLLVAPTSSDKKTIITPIRVETINKDDPAILLLSSPRLKFEGAITNIVDSGFNQLFENGLAQHLSHEQQVYFIEGMYHNLFYTALAEKREYIAMPAAGLGTYGGNPDMYFDALIKVAKEYPTLNIIFHPASHGDTFDVAFKKGGQPVNVAKASKDILVIASKLIQQGKTCALHNPSDCDVVYGLCDVGATWKNGKNKLFHRQKRFIGEEYISTISTAVLNGIGFNLNAYKTIVENPLGAPLGVKKTNSKIKLPISTSTATTSTTTTTSTTSNTNNNNTSGIKTELTSTNNTVNTIPNPLSTTNNTDNNNSKPIEIELNPTNNNRTIPLGLNPNGIHVPSKDKPPATIPTSSLSNAQLKEIRLAITRLQGEIESCWPYPNKDLKQHKVDALNTLMINAQTLSIDEAIKATLTQYPQATDGQFSTRTADLLNSLRTTNVAPVQ